ncbi:COG1664: Integral membrane protein CcmA involved in cell shape determination [Pseudoalteromonas luteoviolacea B = ATCC 29581]|nr:COG1664: Integral membrane protein CcmA involved in cell shape determination [Pseudoalteromonas luteoviolacea B = ATCC 29581]
MFNKKKTPQTFSFLAADILIKGEIQCEGELHLDGMVEGKVCAQHIAVGESGKVKGNIEAQSVEIKGTVEGTISADKVAIEKTANVHGDVIHDTLSMEAGAVVEGSLTHKHQNTNVTPIEPTKTSEAQ